MYLLLRWILSTLSLILVAYITPGISLSSFWVALLAAAVFGLINATIRPFILILTLPVNILTLGLLTFVINGLMLWLVSVIVPGFVVEDFTSAILGALVYCIVITIINMIGSSERSRT